MQQHPRMLWKPIIEEAIWEKLNKGRIEMNARQAKLWDVIRIQPEKWVQEPWGTAGGGFWVVGLIGSMVIWFNDIEDGFNRSSYARYGIIKDYWCNQNELERAIQEVLDIIDTGYETGGFAGPPQPGEFNP